MPGSFGKFGLEITNPIPVPSVPHSYHNLSHLYTSSGQPIRFVRLGSMRAENIKEIIDGYEIYSIQGEKLATTYALITAFPNLKRLKALC